MVGCDPEPRRESQLAVPGISGRGNLRRCADHLVDDDRRDGGAQQDSREHDQLKQASIQWARAGEDCAGESTGKRNKSGRLGLVNRRN